MIYSGNVWGACKRCRKEASQLSSRQAAALALLMERARNRGLPNGSSAGAADIGCYDFEIEDGGRVTRFSIDELSIPDEAAALLEMFEADAEHWNDDG